jgi:TRAP-type C4-dicarboxylate transport system substrate-binding protein
LIASPKLWGSLSDTDKKVFTEAGHALAKATRERSQQMEREGLDVLRGQGMQIVTDIDKSLFAASLKPVRAELEAQFGASKVAAIAAVK